MGNWDLADEVAARQHYVVATWQLRMLEISNQAIAERVSGQAFGRLHRGVIAFPGPNEPIRRLAAAVLAYSRPAGAGSRVLELQQNGVTFTDALVEAAVGSGAVVCGPSALWVYGLEQRAPAPPWIRLPRGCGNATRAGIAVRHGDPSGSVSRINGLPVVDVEQAFMDIPGCRPDLKGQALHHYLSKKISTADARRLTDLNRLEERLDEVGRVVGAVPLRLVLLDLRGQLSHSDAEAKGRLVAREVASSLGLTASSRPHPVDHLGRRAGEADVAVFEIKLDIEIDGPHHDEPAQQHADIVRDRMMRRAGWEVERFPTALVDLHPTVFRARVREAIEHRLNTYSDNGSAPLGVQRM